MHAILPTLLVDLGKDLGVLEELVLLFVSVIWAESRGEEGRGRRECASRIATDLCTPVFCA